MTAAWHSLMQVIPDVAALEAANVGVVVLDPAAGTMRVKVDGTCARAERAFNRHGLDHDELRRSVHLAKTLLLAERDGIRTVDDLRVIANGLGGLVRLSPPRWCEAENIDQWVAEFYARAVLPPHQPRERLSATERTLRDTFGDLERNRRVRFGELVRVPGRSFSVQSSLYYENGRRNVAVVRQFNGTDEGKALSEAGVIAARAKAFADAGSVDGKAYALTLIPHFASQQTEQQLGGFIQRLVTDNGGEVQLDLSAYHRHVAAEADVLPEPAPGSAD